MFRGATKITIDDKGRVVVPVRYRGLLSAASEGRVIVTVDRDECLLIYAAPEWERIEQDLISKPNLDPQVRSMQRQMLGHAEEMVLDSHGRIALTPELREFAGLDRAAWLVGQGKHLELWEETRWNIQREEWKKSGKGVTELAAGLSTLSL